MSGAGDNRAWRRPGQGNRQNQDARSGTSTPTRDGGRQQPVSGAPNVWNTAKGKAAGGADRAPVQSAPVQAPQRGPKSDFNAAEVKDFLKKSYLESIGDQPTVHYKVQGDSVAKRMSGAWSSKGNMSHLMPNGQDFITQLKKQLIALEQKKPS